MFEIVEGDITRQRVDALITMINPQGDWLGGVDRAVRGVAGDLYHDQARSVLRAGNLHNGTIVIAHGSREQHRGQFDNVLFCCDDVNDPLPTYDLVRSTLRVASSLSYVKVALPAIRTGVAVRYFPDVKQTVYAIGQAIVDHQEEDSRLRVVVVVYNDPTTNLLLRSHRIQLN